MTRSRLAAAGLLLAAAAVGAALGAAATSYAEHRERDSRGRGGRDGYVDRLTAELTLTAAQQETIRGILLRTEPVMDSMWREIRPRFDSIRLSVRSEIKAQLTPDQLTRYEVMLARRDSTYRERRSNGRR